MCMVGGEHGRRMLTLSGQSGLVGIRPNRTLILLGKLSPVRTVVTGDAVRRYNDPSDIA